MSTIEQVEWTAKKPSIVQIKKALKIAIGKGKTFIQLTWGENQITIEKLTHSSWTGPWVGNGWIGRHGGSDLADEINKELRK